jgi:cytochrome c oxidase cbb3-type subunit 3
MQGLASYILTFQGTTPQNPKEPQGELYEPKEEPVEVDSAEESETENQEEISMK